MPELPLVGVIVPTYSTAPLMARAASSALAQTVASLEVIVIDDRDALRTKAVPPRSRRARRAAADRFACCLSENCEELVL